jgi:hypothetical protein
LNFLWYDSTVPAVTAATAWPNLQYFADLEILASRSDRKGNETLIVMRSGPPFGVVGQAQHYTHDVGLSHLHQDVNHITLFAGGQFMLVDDGYASRKLTVQHNTLLVNGIGQNYEGGAWSTNAVWPIPDPQPSLTVIESTTGHDYWVGVGASAYPKTAGLQKFDRHVLFIKPNILVAIDDLAAAAPSTFELLWHPGAAVAASLVANQYLIAFKTNTVRATFVLPDGGAVAVGSRAFSVDAGPLTVPEIAATITAQAAQSGALFAWGVDGALNQVSMTRKSGIWVIRTPSHLFTLVPATRTLTTTLL